MELFLCELGAGLTKKQISEAAYALLRRVVSERTGEPCPEIVRREGGKPVFSAPGAPHFSISHSGSVILVGVAGGEIGVDVQLRGDVPGTASRLFSQSMLSQFGYFDGWALRESVFKLCSGGDLRKMEFTRAGGEIISPVPGAKCRLYNLSGRYALAAASWRDDFPENVKIVAPDTFLP